MADLDRQVLFENERFVIGVIQAVSGAGIVGALSQASTVLQLVGPLGFKLFITFMSVALASAVLAALFRHQYKMWDIQGHSAAQRVERGHGIITDLDKFPELKKLFVRSNRYETAMRWTIIASVVFVLAAILILAILLWLPESVSGRLSNFVGKDSR